MHKLESIDEHETMNRCSHKHPNLLLSVKVLLTQNHSHKGQGNIHSHETSIFFSQMNLLRLIDLSFSNRSQIYLAWSSRVAWKSRYWAKYLLVLSIEKKKTLRRGISLLLIERVALWPSHPQSPHYTHPHNINPCLSVTCGHAIALLVTFYNNHIGSQRDRERFGSPWRQKRLKQTRVLCNREVTFPPHRYAESTLTVPPTSFTAPARKSREAHPGAQETLRFCLNPTPLSREQLCEKRYLLR